MNVLVTGANGLLGHHVVIELLKRRHNVQIIVRSTQNIYFDLSKVKVFEGNFAEYECLKQAARGCDAIIHIAAITEPNLLHLDDYRPINVGGVTQVIKIANECAIPNIVYISSANTIGFGNEQLLADECFSIQYPFTRSFYAQSKLESEQLIIEGSGQPNLHYVIINPTFMLGAYDTKPSSGRLLLMGFERKLMLTPKGGKSFVAASSVAIAVCNALTMGRNGEKYLISGLSLSFKDYFNLLKEVGNYNQSIFEVPNFILLLMGRIGDLIRKLGIKTEVSSTNLRQLMIREYYCNDKAKLELNFPDTDIKIAIKEAIDWFERV